MKPESKKNHRNTDKSHCNAEETASCYDLSKLSEALKVAELNKIHHNDKQNEIGSYYDLSKLSEATETIVNSSNSNGNMASSTDEGGSLYDFTKISEALNVVGKERLRILKARREARKEARKEMLFKRLRYYASLDLIDFEPKLQEPEQRIDFEPKLQEPEQRMKSRVTRTPIVYRRRSRPIRITSL